MTKIECSLTALAQKAAGTLTRSEQKRLAIMEAARVTFLEQGFESTSMDQIAKAADVSKRTVYSHFGSKEELFAGIMTAMCETKRETILAPLDPTEPAEKALTEFGRMFLAMIFDPEGTALFRILVGQTANFPDLGREFFDGGPAMTTQLIGDFLKAKTESGELRVDDPVEAAGSFLASLFGAHHIEMLVTNSPPPDEDQRERMIAGAVSRFLHGAVERS